MREKSKYIVIDYMGIETPVIFPAFLSHADMYRAVSSKIGGNIISAGICEFSGDKNENDVRVWAGGRSSTLKVESRIKDSEIIKKEFCHNPY